MKIKNMMHSSLAAALGLLLFVPNALNAAESDNDAPKKIRTHHHAMVSICNDAELKAGETAETIVVIGGSAKVLGDVDRDVVVIGGDAEIEGKVGKNVVSVMGDVHLGPKAEVRRDLVSVGGKTTLAEGATVGGRTEEVSIALGPSHFLRLAWLRHWFRECVMELRPLSPGWAGSGGSPGPFWWFIG